MNRTFRTVSRASWLPAFILCGLVFPFAAVAQLTLPLEIHQQATPDNLQSLRGVPLSAVPGTPPGSDGRLDPIDIAQRPVTPHQFSSMLSYGAVAGNTPPEGLGGDGVETVIMRLQRAQVGAPFLNRPVSFAFGQEIAPPQTDFADTLLSEVDRLTYWAREPHSTNDHEGASYYWSPHAEKVYATQPGPIKITWRKSVPFTAATLPAYTNTLGTASFITNTNDPNIYLLKTEEYLVSGSPIKRPRKIFWTEKSFRNVGKPVRIPASRVGRVNIVYNNTTFPETVNEEYVGIGDTQPGAGTSNAPLPELRTLWYDQAMEHIYAYNLEGRVFVEFLGDLKEDNQTHEQIGIEIVDVNRRAMPTDLRVDLGERVQPPPPETVSTLTPEPLLRLTGTSFDYQHQVSGTEQVELYAAGRTVNENDYQVYWMEEGVASVKWPKVLARYHFGWPDDVTRYSHYVRPPTATEAEAEATAVPLPIANVPFIQYQDVFDFPRANLTADSRFFTWLDHDVPAHRTLLRYTSEDDVAFERVYSWLDDMLITTNLEDTIAEELQSVQAFYNYPEVYSNYLAEVSAYEAAYAAYLQALPRGVNGTWELNVRRFAIFVPLSLSHDGAIAGWELIVRTRDPDTQLAEESVFSNTDGLTLNQGEPGAVPLPSVIQVSGVTDPVESVRVRLRGFTYPQPGELNVALESPAGSASAFLMLVAGGDHPVSNVDLEFSDQASNTIPMDQSIPSGTYLPTVLDEASTMGLGDLLAPVPFEPTAPIPPPGAATPWPEEFVSPRIVRQDLAVGQRVEAPAQELGAGAGEDYFPGYLNRAVGTSYDVTAYQDPFSAGFEAASMGAIIPVNAIPGRNELEVWWFRQHGPRAGAHVGDGSLGFAPVYWPSVIGRYTTHWPDGAPEIVLASNDGGGGLESLQAKGTIYTQNDPGQDGYNPNEEHALMSGGSPYATRDDLNVTNGPAYSSDPFVLLSYAAEDGRPAIQPFKVLREKPEAGLVFDYIVPAGQMLQPPAPLTFLPKPVEGSGDNAVNYNTEPPQVSGDLPGNWDEVRDGDGRFGHYDRFTWRDRKEEFWVYRGPHAGRPPLQAGAYNIGTGSFDALSAAVAVADEPFRYTVHVSRQDQYLGMTATGLPAWLRADGLSLVGTPGAGDAGSAATVTLVVEDRYEHDRTTNTLSISVAALGPAQTQGPLAITSSNQYTGSTVEFTGRPPSLAASPTPANSFTMRYYYKTLEGFAWPGLNPAPAPGSVVPYLRPPAPGGGFVGDPADKATDSLEIVYRPVWPVADPKDSSKGLPDLRFGATLTKPAPPGLPGVRDWITANVLYQQSVASDMTTQPYSAVLHDPTVFKTVDITDHMEMLPGGVRTEPLLGKVYFPNLPPHLGKRLYLDPNRGPKGSLVLKGEFKDEILGDDYLQLNVLRDGDLAAAYAVCPDGDPDYANWVAAIDALTVDVETFYENPVQPGTYIPDPALTEPVGVGDVVEIKNHNVPRDSFALSATGPGSGYVTLVENSGPAFTQPGDPVAMHVIKVGGDKLYRGELKIVPAENPLSELLTFEHTADLAGRAGEFDYEWKIGAPVDGFPPEIDDEMTRYLPLADGTNLTRYTLGGAGIQALGDNYVVMRYRPRTASHPLHNQWSEWTVPALAEGWIKRVLAGINPFTQRVTDLFNNRVNTDVSILTQAGPRWEGDIALNLSTINDYGLIEIYETVLRRGRALSIESGYNYGPANDALLLAAGYLNDLYMMLGNEAWADAANPTIGIGTANNTYGDIATALFSFKGQQASLLDEELALLRGRDDVFQPGVEVRPIYNRLIWNYTRGIDAGEVIYALNYNIQENPDREQDGIINAEDASRMFPQGHGDAYGHYLTAIKGYYSLLLNSEFDWVPRIEAVNILGKPVSVDYQDERKFAAAAAAAARAGRQVFDLTWRKDYQSVKDAGWEHFADARVNTQRDYDVAGGDTANPVRHWGMDQWATRVGQGTYLNWVVGNSMLPAVDPDPAHEGIQKVDRTTVLELKELPTLAEDLQTALDNAEAGFSPLGVPEDAIVLDIDPNVTGASGKTHFEQIYGRATAALNNALVAFDDAKDVTRLMRSEQDSLVKLQDRVSEQELAYRNALIELYGTPYPDDMGPGKTWQQDYAGPDTLHYMYVETPELPFASMWNYPGAVTESTTWAISLADLPSDWGTKYDYTGLEVFEDGNYADGDVIEFSVSPHGYFDKPGDWTSRRVSPGRLQQAISAEIAAHNRLLEAVFNQGSTKGSLDRLIGLYEAENDDYDEIRGYQRDLLIADEVLETAQAANDLFQLYQDSIKEDIIFASDAIAEALPGSLVVGVSSGGDLTSAGRSAIEMAGYATVKVLDKVKLVRNTVVKALETATSTTRRWREFSDIEEIEREVDQRAALVEIGDFFEGMQAQLWGINQALRAYDDAQRQVRTLIAEGDRIQEEREIFRKRSAALVQGYRTRDAAFRIFRNEKLERYKTLFDLSSRYALLAANAYDYETGLLGTDAGRDFTGRIIGSRALGVVGPGGEPQFAGSNSGDPGLSSALAEMKADWDVVRTRLGFNNPDAYGTTVSLRSEHFRIRPGEAGQEEWLNVLHGARVRDLLEDADVRRYCMQITNGDGLPVPGLILEFSTTITDGYNLFGRQLAGGDHAFSPSAFATKIHAAGIALEGYQGMDDPSANSDAGGTSPDDPDLSFLDPTALAATPYVYLIPVGADAMRSPPLGDASEIRTWTVQDLALPMPFNIGDSDFSTAPLYQSNDSLSEPLFTVRKHPSFRPVSDAALFSPSIYTGGGGLAFSQYTSNRLIGRSVWNSRWKLVIPGKTLLSDPDEGLNRLLATLSDVKLHLVTYSYSGN